MSPPKQIVWRKLKKPSLSTSAETFQFKQRKNLKKKPPRVPTKKSFPLCLNVLRCLLHESGPGTWFLVKTLKLGEYSHKIQVFSYLPTFTYKYPPAPWIGIIYYPGSVLEIYCKKLERLKFWSCSCSWFNWCEHTSLTFCEEPMFSLLTDF